MLKRLQSRLIAAFLGVAILVMVPLSISHFYSLEIRFKNTRNSFINGTYDQIDQAVTKITDQLINDFSPAANYIRRSLHDHPELVERLMRSTNPDAFANEEKELWDRFVKPPYDKHLTKGRDLKIIPREQYFHMEEDLQKGNFYLEEDNKIFLWVTLEIINGRHRDEMEPTGALLVKIPFIGISTEPNNYEFPIGSRISGSFLRIIEPRPSTLQPYLDEDTFNQLFGLTEDGFYHQVDVEQVLIPELFGEIPVQARLKPIINQDHELAAIMIFAYPIADVWEMIGPSTIKALVIVSILMIVIAVIISRSISKPMFELVGVARRMSEGDFSQRAEVKGTVEQQILRKTFNHLASQIETQLAQLHRQTDQLELSNRELEQTQRFLQNVLTNIHTGVMSIDRDGCITLINQVGKNILHIDPKSGVHFQSVIHSPSLTRTIDESLANCTSVYQQEIQYRIGDREAIPIQLSTVPILQQGSFTGLVLTFHDLSAIRRLEEEVRRHDRLVALGRMAGGLAHEIRNPLGIIRGSAEILNKRFGGMQGEEGLSEFIIDEANRLSRVLTDFLQFARPPVPDCSRVSVQELFDRILSNAQIQTLPDNYRLEQSIEDNLPDLYIDLPLCQQVFLNLLLNAKEAMPDGGTIRVNAKTQNRHYIAITIQDEGEGIEPEHLDRIFDPFMTTKDQGTGLGLSLVHQIVSSQKGKIEVESKVGKGSRFCVLLPISENDNIDDSFAIQAEVEEELV